MPVTLDQLLDGVATVDVPAKDGQMLHVTYRTQWYSADYEDAMNTTNDSDKSIFERHVAQAWITIALCLIAEWDLVGPDGAPVPLTREGLRPVQLAALQNICNAVWAAANPPKSPASGSSSKTPTPISDPLAEPKTTGSASSRTPKRAIARRGSS